MDGSVIILVVILAIFFRAGFVSYKKDKKFKKKMVLELEQFYPFLNQLIQLGDKSSLAHSSMLVMIKEDYQSIRRQDILWVKTRNGLDLLRLVHFFIKDLKKYPQFKTKEHVLMDIEFQLEEVTKLFVLYYTTYHFSE